MRNNDGFYLEKSSSKLRARSRLSRVVSRVRLQNAVSVFDKSCVRESHEFGRLFVTPRGRVLWASAIH